MNASIRTITGNIGSIQTYRTKTAKVFARVRIARNYRLKTNDGMEQQFTSWYTVKVWDKDKVESFKKQFALGDFIQVRGTLTKIVFQNDVGSRQTELEINPNQVVLLYSKPRAKAASAKVTFKNSTRMAKPERRNNRKPASGARWPNA